MVTLTDVQNETKLVLLPEQVDGDSDCLIWAWPSTFSKYNILRKVAESLVSTWLWEPHDVWWGQRRLGSRPFHVFGYDARTLWEEKRQRRLQAALKSATQRREHALQVMGVTQRCRMLSPYPYHNSQLGTAMGSLPESCTLRAHTQACAHAHVHRRTHSPTRSLGKLCLMSKDPN